MAEVAKKYQDQLERIKKNVEKSRMFFEDNYKRYNREKKFYFHTTLGESERATLNEIGQPQIECNLCEAYISRLRGEFSKSEPSIEVSADYNSNVDQNLIDVIEGYVRHSECEARKDGTAYGIFTDMSGGGWGVAKVYTDYENEMSFHQNLGWEKLRDPTLTGFDPLAKESHKGDGEFCFELFPKTKEEFAYENPNIDISNITWNKTIEGFNWSYNNDREKILLMCDYYEKKKKKLKILLIAKTPAIEKLGIDTTLTQDEYDELINKWSAIGGLEQPPEIIETRNTDRVSICRYRFIENQVLEYVETDYKYLPLVFFDANSVTYREPNSGEMKQVCRSYPYNAIGTQQLVNVALQSIGNELQNTIQHKFIIAKEAIPPEYLKSYTDVQIPNVVVYNAFLEKEGVTPGEIQLPPPREVVRPPMPPEMLQTINLGFSLMQNILGSYDSSSGNIIDQTSGRAVMAGAVQSSAAAMPIIVGYMQGLNQIAQIFLDLIPKYLTTPRTIPILLPDGKRAYAEINTPNGLKIDYDSNALNIKVEAGVNFSVQKAQAVQQIQSLMSTSPNLAQFFSSPEGLPVLLKNIEIHGAENLTDQIEAFIQKQQQMQAASMANNPQLMKAQTDRAKVEIDAHQAQVDNQLKAAQIAINKDSVDNDRLKILGELDDAKMNAVISLDKHQTEKTRAAVDMAISMADHDHNKMIDIVSLDHKKTIDNGELQHKLINTAFNHLDNTQNINSM